MRRPFWFLAVLAIMSGCTQAPSVDPAPENTSTDYEATDRRVMQCLADLGWEIVDVETGESRVPEEQLSQFNLDSEMCLEQVAGPIDTTPLTDEELVRLYEVEGESVECLATLGYAIDLPSLQTFMDGYHNGAPFTAYADLLGQLNASEYSKATDACPPAALTFER
jgi:hypothetical protein